MLPESGIPEALRSTIVESEREESEEPSDRGYVKQRDTPTDVEVDEPYIENWSMTAVVDVNATKVTPNELRENAKKKLTQNKRTREPARKKKKQNKGAAQFILDDTEEEDDGDANSESDAGSLSDSDVHMADTQDQVDTAPVQTGAADPGLPVHSPLSDAAMPSPQTNGGNRQVLVFPRTANFAPDARNPDFWQGAFPALFPWGVGVPCQSVLKLRHLDAPLAIKKSRLSLREHGHSLLRQPESDCRLHPHFMFVLFNHLQKVEAFQNHF